MELLLQDHSSWIFLGNIGIHTHPLFRMFRTWNSLCDQLTGRKSSLGSLCDASWLGPYFNSPLRNDWCSWENIRKWMSEIPLVTQTKAGQLAKKNLETATWLCPLPVLQTQPCAAVIVPQAWQQLAFKFLLPPTYPIVMKNKASAFHTGSFYIIFFPQALMSSIGEEVPVQEMDCQICIRLKASVITEAVGTAFPT